MKPMVSGNELCYVQGLMHLIKWWILTCRRLVVFSAISFQSTGGVDGQRVALGFWESDLTTLTLGREYDMKTVESGRISTMFLLDVCA